MRVALVIHAVAMSVLVFLVTPLLYLLAKRWRGQHVAIAPVVLGIFVMAFVQAFWLVEPPGNHDGLHAVYALITVCLMALLGLCAALRSKMTVARKTHVWLGRLLIAVALPFTWLTGVRSACEDVGTGYSGHAGVSLCALLLGLYTYKWPRFGRDQARIEAAILAAAGAANLVGDLLLSSHMPANRVEHLFLYSVFFAFGLVGYNVLFLARFASSAAFALFSLIVSFHKGGHDHNELDRAMHAVSGIALAAVAIARFVRNVKAYSISLIFFAIVFVFSQPALCNCWNIHVPSGMTYIGLVLVLCIVQVGFLVVANTDPGTKAALDNDVEASKEDGKTT